MRIPALPKTTKKHHQSTQPLLKVVRSAIAKKIKGKKQFVSVPKRH